VTTVLLGTDDGIIAIDGAIGGETDGATTSNGDPRFELPGHAVTNLRRGPEGWWAVADGRELFQRASSGAWEPVVSADASLTCVLPVAGGALAGTDDGRLLRVYEDALVPITGFDAVEGRDGWHAVGSRKPYVRSLTITADAQAVLANVHVGGIPRSGNGGASWAPTIDVEADVHEVRAHPSDPALVMAVAAVGIAESRDAGVTWSISTRGLHATYARAVAFTTGAVLVSVSDGPFTKRGALYRRSLDGGDAEDAVAERCSKGLPEWLAGNVDTGSLDAHGEHAAFADAGGNLYTSTDTGHSWHHLTTIPTIHAVGILEE
jgi:hypothetical protein